MYASMPRIIQLAVYQVTDSGLCDELLELYKKGINVTVLVSDYIVSTSDYYRAQVSTDSYTLSLSLSLSFILSLSRAGLLQEAV